MICRLLYSNLKNKTFQCIIKHFGDREIHLMLLIDCARFTLKPAATNIASERQ